MVKELLHKMIINNVDDKYICELKNARTKYQQVDPIDLMEHLWYTYGRIESSYLTRNEERVK